MPAQPTGPGHAPAHLHDALPRHGTVLQSNPFVVASAVAMVGVAVLATADRSTVETLHIHHISQAETPVLDGDTSDPVWRNAPPISVITGQGDNFDGEGGTTVEIRAVNDGTWAYFRFVWNDPTRSLKQLPLRKSADGWHLLHDGYELGDEHAYNEDKLLGAADAVRGPVGGRQYLSCRTSPGRRQARFAAWARPALHRKRRRLGRGLAMEGDQQRTARLVR